MGIGGIWAEYEVCQGGWCYWDIYSYRANINSFALTNNGVVQSSLFSKSFYDSDCTYFGGEEYPQFECWEEHRATGTVPTYAGQTHTLLASVNISGPYGTQTRQRVFTAPAAAKAPVVSTLAHYGSSRTVGACAFNCFEGTLSYSIPSYVSQDVERTVSLVYNGRHVTPNRLVQLDATHPAGGGTPPVAMSLRLQRSNGSFVTFAQGMQEIYYKSGSGTTRLAAWFDDAPSSPSSTVYTAHVTSIFGDASRVTSLVPVRVLSAYSSVAGSFGAGWRIAGIESLFEQADGGILLSSSDGSLGYFAPCHSGCNTYVSPTGDYSTLVKIPGGSGGVYYRRTFPDESTISYDVYGRLIQVKDRFNNATNYTYAGVGHRLGQITDPVGKVTTFTYDANGNLDYITDPFGRVTQITVTAGGNLTEIFRPGGAYALQVAYDGSRKITHYFDARGGRWDLTWDNYGRLASEAAPGVVANHTPAQRPTTSYRSLEKTLFASVATGKGTAGNPADRMLPSDVKVAVWNPRGQLTEVGLDRFGQAVRIEEPLGRVTKVTRDTIGRTLRSESPSGHIIGYHWSGINLAKIADSSLGRSQSFSYLAGTSYLTHSSGTMSVPEWYEWSTSGPRRLLRTRVGSAVAPPTEYVTDAQGRLQSVTAPLGHKTTFTYYGAGTLRNTHQVQQGGRVQTYAYNAYGLPSLVSDPLGQTRATVYDPLNRITKSIGNANDTTHYAYDALYQTSLTDPKGQVYQYVPNALGWVEQAIDPTGKSEYFSYDLNGNVIRARGRMGVADTVSYSYDALDQLTQRRYAGSTTTYKTDSLGRWTATATAASVDTLHFDIAGRPYKEVSVRSSGRYERLSTLSLQDRRTGLSITGPTGSWGSVSYGYSAYGDLESITDLSGRQVSLTRNANRVVTGLSYPWAGTINKAPSAYQLPGQILYSGGGVSLGSLSARFSRDEGGRISEVFNETLTVGTLFEYDPAGRLARSVRFSQQPNTCGPVYESGEIPDGEAPIEYDCNIPGARSYGPDSTYAYDKVGNRTGPGTLTDPGNRLRSYDGASLTYDLAGRLTQRVRGAVVETFTWAPTGELLSMSSNQVAGSWNYTYDGWGRRIRTVAPDGSTVEYLHDGENLVAELDVSGNRLREYTYFPGIDSPHSMRSGGKIYYYVMDGLGNVNGLADTAGTLVNTYRYDDWGKLVAGTSESVYNPLRFKAREHDEGTGLIFMRARYYYPSIRRFISEDPIGLAGGINLYTFSGNDPVNNADPTGNACVATYWIQFNMESGDIINMTHLFTECDDDEKRGGGGGGGGKAGGKAASSQNSCGPENSSGVRNFLWGVGDVALLGFGDELRDAFGIAPVDMASKAYFAGEITGSVAILATGVGGGMRAAGTAARGLEFSHFIPARMGGARSIWNGNFVSTATHALSDPYRYRFMSRTWKAANPMPSRAKQLWVRTPNTAKGTVAGASAAATGLAKAGC